MFITTFAKRSINLRLCSIMATSALKLPKADERHFYVWVDLEMTGLDVNIHKIVEVACIVTTPQIEILDEGLHIVVHQSKHTFENECDKWSYEQHKKSGLMELSLQSKINIEEADDLVSNYVKKLTDNQEAGGVYYIAGNSVYMDKIFIEKFMPKLNSLLHYRIIDISTIKTLCSFWYSSKFQGLPKKRLEHRALSDVHESIEELKHYRHLFFTP